MASCVGNILAKNYQNVIIGFQVTVENVGDVFLNTACSHFEMKDSVLDVSEQRNSAATRSMAC